MNKKLPRWETKSIYTGFDSDEYIGHKKALTNAVDDMVEKLKTRPESDLGPWLKDIVSVYNRASDLYENLETYCYMAYSTDTNDARAIKELGTVEELAVPFETACVLLRNRLAEIKDQIPKLMDQDHELKETSYFFEQQLLFQSKQMTEAEENLAADLNRSGGEAWGKLQQALSSNTSALWNEETGETKTIVELRALAFDADREIRRKAFEKEIAAWKGIEIPMAFALNGVKGFTLTTNRRQNWDSPLEKARTQARISKKTLDALIGSMEEALPDFRRYLKTKAKMLNTDKLGFFDLFAPVGSDAKKWTYDEAAAYIVETFTNFSTEMGEFAKKAFDNNWIDAEPRAGKVAGAYCIGVPLNEETRIMANFDGSFSSVLTLAHELGHGYHHEVLKTRSHIDRAYPMTLAETASIFAETLVIHRALSETSKDQKAAIIEQHLQDSTQVIVDILSRFYFEREAFKKRESGDLSAGDYCSLMTQAQKDTYGDGLDEELLHPYMWAVKGHYYSTGLSFYNFPYAFGQLFGLGIYAAYEEDPSDFASRYAELLKNTGRMSAEDVTKTMGFDIESREFWKKGLATIRDLVDQLESLA